MDRGRFVTPRTFYPYPPPIPKVDKPRHFFAHKLVFTWDLWPSGGLCHLMCFACRIFTSTSNRWGSAVYDTSTLTGTLRIHAHPELSFLLANDPSFREIAATAFRQSRSVSAADSERFADSVHRAIKHYNLAGLCDPRRRNMYPFTGTVALRTDITAHLSTQRANP